MFDLRKIDFEQDIQKIIRLLNDNYPTVHTEEAFLWKHAKNPFGKSHGLVIPEGDQIIGLKIFMWWEFLCDGKKIKCLRPVDAVVDKHFRRKGLWTKLTKQGLVDLEDEYDLIIAAPNENSTPGNKKMGWKGWKDFKYKAGLVNFLGNSEEYKDIVSKEIVFDQSWLQSYPCQTNLSKDFLEWRYLNSERYKIAQFQDENLIIYRLQKLKGLNTLILMDMFGDEKKFSKQVRSICLKNNVKIVYYLNNQKSRNLKFLFSLERRSQTVLNKDDRYGIVDKIEFSEGDLEAKL